MYHLQLAGMIAIIFYFLFVIQRAQAVAPKKVCDSPLGLVSGKITDSQISASCYQYEVNLEGGHFADARPRSARLNRTGAWCCFNTYMRNVHLTISLEHVMYISGIATQGIEGVLDYFVKTFSVYTSINGSDWKVVYRDLNTSNKVWMGNTDGLGIKTNTFSQLVQARYIRISPLTYSYKMCMKLELFGCRKMNNTVKQHPTDNSNAQLVHPATTTTTTVNNTVKQHPTDNSNAQSVHPATTTTADKGISTRSYHFDSHLANSTIPFTTQETIANVSSGILGIRTKRLLQMNQLYFIAASVAIVIGMIMIAAGLRQRGVTKLGFEKLKSDSNEEKQVISV